LINQVGGFSSLFEQDTMVKSKNNNFNIFAS